ncbi:MAG: DciA family protein [Vicinamibacterales bacterium]
MARSGEFVPTRACVPDTVSAVLARQPLTPGKIAFAWQMAVGPALARATSVEYESGVLRVSSGDRRWMREVERSRAVILGRLRSLLGSAVSELRTENPARPEGRAYGEDCDA